MRKIKVRNDLMSKSEYSRQYKISRPKIDEMINNGQLSVEEISGTHFIKII